MVTFKVRPLLNVTGGKANQNSVYSDEDSTMTSEQINDIMKNIIERLNKKCGAELREV